MFKILFSLLLFLFPLFFLPFTPEFFETAKILLLAILNLFFLIYWLYRAVKSKNLTIFFSPLDFLVLLYGFVFILSLIFNWGALAKYQAVLLTSYILNFIFLYFVILNLTKKEDKKVYSWALISGGVFLSIFSFILFLLPKNVFPLNFNLLNYTFTIPNIYWSPAGTSIVNFSYFIILVAFLLPEFLKSLKENFSLKFLFLFLSLLVLTAGTFLEGYKLFLNKPFLLPYSSGWAIAVEGFKKPKSLFFGNGPGQFFAVFAKHKPIFFNQTNFWNLRFASSSNEYFQIISTLGLIGFLSFILLAIKGISLSLKKSNFSLLALFFLFLFLPANILTLFLLFIFLGLNANEFKEEKYRLEKKDNFFYLPLILLALFSGGLFYLLFRNYLAENYHQKAVLAASRNQGKSAYDWEIKAIKINPYNDNYRISFSSLNFLLASNLIQKKDLSDQEKQVVSQLLQQALNEARNAVSLSKENPANWEHLAFIYRNLINTAQGADQWAINTLRQAIALDPANPRLRVDLGGLFYTAKKYELAIDLFKSAINLKPDYANAYYNLAYAYKEKGEYQNAVSMMETVLTLVNKDSNDFQKAKSDLEEFKKLLPTPTQGEKPTPTVKPETLSLPSPAPTPKAEITPIVLPEPKEATKSGE